MLKPQDSKSIYPDALVDEIAAAIGIDDPRRRRLLAEGLRDVAQHADSCRRTYSIAPPGVRAEALDRIKVAYDQLLASLQIDPANPDPQRAIHGHDALPFIIWHVAAGRNPQWPEGQITPAQEGFEDQVKSLLEFREATIAALCDTEPRITRGRGGARRRPDEALELVA
jgi:hypothetical protein